MAAGYQYSPRLRLESARSAREAIRMTVVNYFHDQLGWSLARCEQRAAAEEVPTIHGDLLCTVGRAVAIWGEGRLLPAGMAPLLQFAIPVPSGVPAYPTLAFLTRQSVLQELAGIRLHFASRRARPAPSV